MAWRSSLARTVAAAAERQGTDQHTVANLALGKEGGDEAVVAAEDCERGRNRRDLATDAGRKSRSGLCAATTRLSARSTTR